MTLPLLYGTPEEALLPAAVPQYRDLERRRRLHSYALHVRSSQAFALNLFAPLEHDGVLTVLRALGLSAVEADPPEFEYEDPTRALAEGSAGGGHQTQVDVVLRGRDADQRRFVALVEVKLTETDFSGCSAYTNPTNPRRDICHSEGLFGSDTDNCFQLTNHGGGQRRRYDTYLADVPVTWPAPPHSGGGCLVRDGLNQPMRNLALAHMFLDTGQADTVVYALTAPAAHQVIWRRFTEVQAAFPDTATRSIVVLSADTVADAHPDLGQSFRRCYPQPVSALRPVGKRPLSFEGVSILTTPKDAPEPADPGCAAGGPSDAAASALAHDLAGLLRLTGHSSLQGLSEEIYDSFELDAWIPPLEEQEGEPDLLLIRVHDRGVSLPYPFTVEDLWEAISDLEDEISAAWEAESEAESEADRSAK